MLKRKSKTLNVVIMPVGGRFVAQVLEVHLFGGGATPEAALDTLFRVIKKHVDRSLARHEEPFKSLPTPPPIISKLFGKAWAVNPLPEQATKKVDGGIKIGSLKVMQGAYEGDKCAPMARA